MSTSENDTAEKAANAAEKAAADQKHVAASPSLSLVKLATPKSYNAVGQKITYTYVITNYGAAELPPAQCTVTDDHIGTPPGTPFNCDSVQPLAVGASLTCTATYTITQSDLDSGSVTNTARAAHGAATSNPSTTTITRITPEKPSHWYDSISTRGWNIISFVLFDLLLVGLLILLTQRYIVPPLFEDWIYLGVWILFAISIVLTLLFITGVTDVGAGVRSAKDTSSDLVRRGTVLSALGIDLLIAFLIVIVTFNFSPSRIVTQGQLGAAESAQVTAAAATTSIEILIALYVILGVSVLMTLLLIMAQGFDALHLTQSDQPLGLPAGSIRAMIALILLLIFILVGTYLFRAVSTPIPSGVLEGLTTEQVILLGPRILNSTPRQVIPTPAAGTVPPIAPATVTVYDVTLASALPQDAVQLAQQMLTMIGTLVVAVSGFYFGSRAMEESRPEQKPNGTVAPLNPVITKLDPANGTTGDSNVSVTITGENLQPERVKLHAGAPNPPSGNTDDIPATNVAPIPTGITCVFNLTNKAPGTWNLTIKNYNLKDESNPLPFTIDPTPS